MIAALLLGTGAVLAGWIALRNPGPGEPYAWWPLWWEWAVGTFGVVLMEVAALLVLAAIVLEVT